MLPAIHKHSGRHVNAWLLRRRTRRGKYAVLGFLLELTRGNIAALAAGIYWLEKWRRCFFAGNEAMLSCGRNGDPRTSYSEALRG